MFTVDLRSFGAFPIFDNLYLENGWLQCETDENLGLGGKYSVYAGYFWQLSAEGQSEVIQSISDFQQVYVSHLSYIHVAI